mmetsp:Transcript_3735/g.501  ORF Transcript_3735/g.501 Transcript_3735/m.501 type:complete len:161 (+) Transcript_3735:4086-4568(+)
MIPKNSVLLFPIAGIIHMALPCIRPKPLVQNTLKLTFQAFYVSYDLKLLLSINFISEFLQLCYMITWWYVLPEVLISLFQCSWVIVIHSSVRQSDLFLKKCHCPARQCIRLCFIYPVGQFSYSNFVFIVPPYPQGQSKNLEGSNTIQCTHQSRKILIRFR